MDEAFLMALSQINKWLCDLLVEKLLLGLVSKFTEVLSYFRELGYPVQNTRR